VRVTPKPPRCGHDGFGQGDPAITPTSSAKKKKSDIGTKRYENDEEFIGDDPEWSRMSGWPG
jgi:hypothetical protein